MFNVLITGGSGYVGRSIAQSIHELKLGRVYVYDIDFNNHDGRDVVYLNGSVTDEKLLTSYLVQYKVNAVIHCAGYGMCGKSNLPRDKDLNFDVNVNGARAVTNSALHSDSTKILVYTSTVNVSFNGNPVNGGTENDPSPLKFIDYYSENKFEAEKIILNTRNLKTCSLRLGGVYGPNDNGTIRRIICYIKSSNYCPYISCVDPSVKLDFVHIKNVKQAHTKSLLELMKEDTQINGKSFYITDGHPRTITSLLKPLVLPIRGTEYNPWVFLTPKIAILFSYILVGLQAILGDLFVFPVWGLSPMEAYKISVTHWFCIDKARESFGYEPLLYGWEDIIESFGINDEERALRKINWGISFSLSFLFLVLGYLLFIC